MGKSITINNIRPIYFDVKRGLPKEESLKDRGEILKHLDINLNTMTKQERAYTLNLLNSCLSSIRSDCRDRRIPWVDIYIEGKKLMVHGITHRIELLESNLARCKDREQKQHIIYKKVKEITEEHLLLAQ